MKLTAALYGLVAAAGVLSQSDDYPPLKSDGPYTLHVKGKTSNSSIDGYLYVASQRPGDLESGASVLHYDPVSANIAGNSSYRFYFNTSVEDTSDLGFLVTDITTGDATGLYRGKPMMWTLFADSNVALLEFDYGADPYNVQFIGFGKGGKGYVYSQHDDSTAVAGKPVNETSVDLYDGWAICWLMRYTVTGYTLSWITYGEPHNPTCERVDLTRSKVY